LSLSKRSKGFSRGGKSVRDASLAFGLRLFVLVVGPWSLVVGRKQYASDQLFNGR
jgi:hypothetical protein